jgi:hypothetical protein
MMFVRARLNLLKLKAKRTGIWYKALNHLDRALVDLTIKVADRVMSLRLAKALSAIIKKIEEALESKISKAIRMVGLPLAYKLGLIAKKWGNPHAEKWIFDLSFARFLAVMRINSGRGGFT